VADTVDERSYFGLAPEATYVYGTCRDDAGEIATMMRRIPFAGAASPVHDGEVRRSLGSRLVLMRTDEDEYQLSPAGRRSASADGVHGVVDGDTACFDSVAEGAPFRVRFSPESFTYEEQGAIDLRGRLIGPGLHWFLPGRDSATYYVSQIYQVEGTVLGREARGFVCFDQVYMPPGGVLYAVHDAMMGAELELAWYTWATRWVDGTVEAGHFTLGHDRFGFAVFTDTDGNVTATSEVDGVVTRSADGYWTDGVRFDVAGEAWEFVPDPRGRMGALGRMPNPQQEGLMRRVGDDREPAVWMAWGETVPSHGETRRQRYSV
jgi:hypothetical protein